MIENVRTDIEPLKKRFPNLKGIDSAEWECELLTKQGGVPGPSDYCLKGIIVLDDVVAEEYWNKYEWVEVMKEIEANYVDLSEYKNRTWYVSNEMKKDIISTRFVGDIYISEKYLWFNLLSL